MDQAVKSVLIYFRQFDYIPTEEEIRVFLSKKCSASKLKLILTKFKKCCLNGQYRYTLEEYRLSLHQLTQRYHISVRKIQKVRLFIQMVGFFPQIQLIGISGSVAMLNAKESDDVDFFIIASKGRLWTCRFIINCLAFFLGKKRWKNSIQVKDTICPNLFFEELDLAVPEMKQNVYVAHELLQVRYVFMRGDMVKQLITANEWVFNFFPNARLNFLWKKIDADCIVDQGNKTHNAGMSYIFKLLESFLRHFQLWLMNDHRTLERITDTQLWFHPHDYEKKLRRLGII